MSSEMIATHEQRRRCVVVHAPSGTALSTDPPISDGGGGTSFSPTDLLGAALSTCILTILLQLAERHGVSLERAEVEVSIESTPSPRRLSQVRTQVMIPAADVPAGPLRSRFEAAAKTCPIHRGLYPQIDAPIEFVYPEESA